MMDIAKGASQENRERIARTLRRAADMMTEMAAKFNRLADAAPTDERVDGLVAQAMHTILWGVANMSLDTMITDAGETASLDAVAKEG